MKVACGDMEIIASLPPSSGVAMVMFSVVSVCPLEVVGGGGVVVLPYNVPAPCRGHTGHIQTSSEWAPLYRDPPAMYKLIHHEPFMVGKWVVGTLLENFLVMSYFDGR